MKELLKNNEVLNFCFDDFNSSFSTICVQSKDLYLYEIDFLHHKLLRKILPGCHNIKLNSIFYSIKNKEKNMKKYQAVKEFIQHEKGIGNKIILPKINDEILIVK